MFTRGTPFTRIGLASCLVLTILSSAIHIGFATPIVPATAGQIPSYIKTDTIKITSGDMNYVASATSSTGVRYITGIFSGTLDFDPSAGVDEHSSPAANIYSSDTRTFLTKFNADGSYAWTHLLGAPGTSMKSKIFFDANDNLIFAGAYKDTVNFNPFGSDIHNANSGTGRATFVTKYNADGSYAWTRTTSLITTQNQGYAFFDDAISDDSGNIYISADYLGSVLFDTGTNTQSYSKGYFSSFIIKYLPDGTFGWVRTWGSPYAIHNAPSNTGSTYGGELSIIENTLYAASTFWGNVAFNPNGTNIIVGNDGYGPTNYSGFISMFDTNGNYVETKTYATNPIETGNVTATGSLVGDDGKLYVFGSFSGTINFNPNGSDAYTSQGNNSFLLIYDQNFEYLETKVWQGSSTPNYFYGFKTEDGNIHLSGHANGTLAFNPDGSDIRNTNGASAILTTLDPTGNYVATQIYGPTGTAGVLSGVQLSSDGKNLYITSWFTGTRNFHPQGNDIKTITSPEVKGIAIAQHNFDESLTPASTTSSTTTTTTSTTTTTTTLPPIGDGEINIEYAYNQTPSSTNLKRLSTGNIHTVRVSNTSGFSISSINFSTTFNNASITSITTNTGSYNSLTNTWSGSLAHGSSFLMNITFDVGQDTGDVAALCIDTDLETTHTGDINCFEKDIVYADANFSTYGTVYNVWDAADKEIATLNYFVTNLSTNPSGINGNSTLDSDDHQSSFRIFLPQNFGLANYSVNAYVNSDPTGIQCVLPSPASTQYPGINATYSSYSVVACHFTESRPMLQNQTAQVTFQVETPWNFTGSTNIYGLFTSDSEMSESTRVTNTLRSGSTFTSINSNNVSDVTFTRTSGQANINIESVPAESINDHPVVNKPWEIQFMVYNIRGTTIDQINFDIIYEQNVTITSASASFGSLDFTSKIWTGEWSSANTPLVITLSGQVANNPAQNAMVQLEATSVSAGGSQITTSSSSSLWDYSDYSILWDVTDTSISSSFSTTGAINSGTNVNVELEWKNEGPNDTTYIGPWDVAQKILLVFMPSEFTYNGTSSSNLDCYGGDDVGQGALPDGYNLVLCMIKIVDNNYNWPSGTTVSSYISGTANSDFVEGSTKFYVLTLASTTFESDGNLEQFVQANSYPSFTELANDTTNNVDVLTYNLAQAPTTTTTTTTTTQPQTTTTQPSTPTTTRPQTTTTRATTTTQPRSVTTTTKPRTPTTTRPGTPTTRKRTIPTLPNVERPAKSESLTRALKELQARNEGKVSSKTNVSPDQEVRSSKTRKSSLLSVRNILIFLLLFLIIAFVVGREIYNRLKKEKEDFMAPPEDHEWFRR